MGARNSVVEHAVERNSWGKSRDELSCRFQNNGGLHRISGDAPLETQILLTYEEGYGRMVYVSFCNRYIGKVFKRTATGNCN